MMAISVAVDALGEGLLLEDVIVKLLVNYGHVVKGSIYMSQAEALNFLLNLQIWSWYARRSGASCGHSERIMLR